MNSIWTPNRAPQASALAAYLNTGAASSVGVLWQTGFTPHTAANYGMLFAYSDGTNVHIADVKFASNLAAAGTGNLSALTVVGATDLVELVGVSSLASLNAHNIHILA